MRVFSKSNNSKWKDALQVEALGLELLREFCTGLCIRTPKVLSVDEGRLEMERIDCHSCLPDQSRLLGQDLARMHSRAGSRFGLDYDNMIGLNRQKNLESDNWGEFFVQLRLQFQISLVEDSELKAEFCRWVDGIAVPLVSFLNSSTQHPSLLHGDLWSGNYLCSREDVWLIDPAVYFGDREADLAMTRMFGGFSAEFYLGYESITPLSADFSLKERVYNLYHYLNHFNLFGGSYLSACRTYMKDIARAF